MRSHGFAETSITERSSPSYSARPSGCPEGRPVRYGGLNATRSKRSSWRASNRSPRRTSCSPAGARGPTGFRVEVGSNDLRACIRCEDSHDAGPAPEVQTPMPGVRRVVADFRQTMLGPNRTGSSTPGTSMVCPWTATRRVRRSPTTLEVVVRQGRPFLRSWCMPEACRRNHTPALQSRTCRATASTSSAFLHCLLPAARGTGGPDRAGTSTPTR